MEDHSTTAFIQSFVQFSCEIGYPKFSLVDEGSGKDMSVNELNIY